LEELNDSVKLSAPRWRYPFHIDPLLATVADNPVKAAWFALKAEAQFTETGPDEFAQAEAAGSSEASGWRGHAQACQCPGIGSFQE